MTYEQEVSFSIETAFCGFLYTERTTFKALSKCDSLSYMWEACCELVEHQRHDWKDGTTQGSTMEMFILAIADERLLQLIAQTRILKMDG